MMEVVVKEGAREKSNMALVIIIESTPAVAALAQEGLEAAGYATLVALKLDAGYKLVRYHRPNLVLLGAPAGGGNAVFASIQALRADAQTAAIPIIVLDVARRLQPEDEQHLRADHCTLLAGPLDHEKLLRAVSTLIGAPSSRAVGE